MSRPLRVCLISEEYPPETGWGGIGTYTWNLAGGLAALGHRVNVVTRGWEGNAVDERDRVRVHRLSIPEPSWRCGTRFLTTRFYEARQILLWNLRVRAVVGRLARAEGLDVVESPEYHAQGLLARVGWPRLPMVVKLHSPAYLLNRINGVPAGWSRSDTVISERVEAWLARRASLVTSPSRKLAADVARPWHLDPGAVRVLPNPIDDEQFRDAAGVARDEHAVLYVGRIERRKGVETLVEALPAILDAVPRARAHLVGQDHPSGPGGGSMTDHLRRRLHDLGVPATVAQFAGSVDRRMLPGLYLRAGVCVVPSLYENFPYTCLEAMAAGCAVVASAVGGIPEIVTDRVDGLLVPPGQPAALAAAVIALLSDPPRRRRLGEQARETVRERFSRAVASAQTARAYAELMEAGA